MPKLYLMRHGQTQFNLQKLVQGRCDSPLTELGVKQARAAGRWLAKRGVAFDRMCVSPLGRTRATADVVRSELAAVPHAAATSGTAASQSIAFHAPAPTLPPIEFLPGLIERSYGTYEGGPQADVPADVWDPGESLVAHGGEGSVAVRKRMVDTLTSAMNEANGENVLAVSHGSATLQFKKAWEHLATCDQNVPLGNCCILIYEFDRATMTFTCEQIVNHEL